MKKTLMLFCVLVLAACGRKIKEKAAANDRIEITSFIVTKLILKDTTQLKTIYAQTDSGRISMNDYKEFVDDLPMYLDRQQFKNFEAAVWALVRNPKSNVFYGSDKPISKADLRSRMIHCDSIKSIAYDAEGTEVATASFMCDSTTSVHNINMIRFAETWYFNKANNMLEREILGYSVFEYVPEKMGFKSLFEVYPNEESRKKAKKYDFW